MTIKYIATAKEWFDKINGNSYFSVQIESTEDKDFLINIPFQSGYGEQSFYTAREILKENKLISADYTFPSELPIKNIMIDRCLKKEVQNFGQGIVKDFNPNIDGVSSYYKKGNHEQT
jgi:hypothetical protein